MNNPGEERQGRRPFIREKDNEKSLKGWWWWASRERHEYLPACEYERMSKAGMMDSCCEYQAK
jgi:hypothetical protein